MTRQIGDATNNRYNYYYYSPPYPSQLLLEGTYILHGSSGVDLTYYIPDQTSILEDVVLIIPSVELDENGKIKKISWTYKILNASEPVDPRDYIKTILINLTYGYGPNNGIPTIFADPSAKEIDISSKDIDWNRIFSLSIGYVSIYQTIYNFEYQK